MFVRPRDSVGAGVVEKVRVVMSAGQGDVDRVEQIEPVFRDVPHVRDVAVDVQEGAPRNDVLFLPLRRQRHGVLGARRSGCAETQARLVVELPFLAFEYAVEGAVLEVLAVAVREPRAHLVSPEAVERGQGGGPAVVPLDGVRPGLGIGETRAEDETVRLQFGVRPPPHQVEARVRRWRETRLDVDGTVAMAVLLVVASPLARHRDAVRVNAHGMRGEVVAVASGAEARNAARRTKGPGLGPDGNLRFAVSPSGNDVDDAADRVAAPQCALGPAKHFDALDFVRKEISEVEFRSVRRIAHLDPIDQNEGLIRFRAPDADLRLGSDVSRATDGDAGNLAEDLADETVLLGVDVVAVDDGHGAADRRGRDGYPAGGYHDFRQHLDLRRQVLRSGAEDCRRAGQDKRKTRKFAVEFHGWLPN